MDGLWVGLCGATGRYGYRCTDHEASVLTFGLHRPPPGTVLATWPREDPQ